jgi:hypothetical protein
MPRPNHSAAICQRVRGDNRVAGAIITFLKHASATCKGVNHLSALNGAYQSRINSASCPGASAAERGDQLAHRLLNHSANDAGAALAARFGQRARKKAANSARLETPK